MSYEIDMPDIQLPSTDAKPRAGTWTEIGKAEITHTIFGKAKVRIIREHDRTRRARLLAALMLTALAAAAWLGWIASQQTEPQQSAAPLPPVSAKVQESAPAFQPENVASPAMQTIAESKPITPPLTEVNKPAIAQKEPHQSQGSKGDEQITVKPVKSPALKTSKPQMETPATDNNATKNQTDKPLPPKLPSPNQPVATAVAIPPATKQVAQPPASSPVAVHPLAVPLVKEGNTTQSPAGNIQPTDPVNSPGK